MIAMTNGGRSCPSAQASLGNPRHSAGGWSLSTIFRTTRQASSPPSSSPPAVFIPDRHRHDQRAGCGVAEEQPVAQGAFGAELVVASVPMRAALSLVQAARVVRDGVEREPDLRRQPLAGVLLEVRDAVIQPKGLEVLCQR